VLIVDDNADGAESLALLLRFAGHVIEVAHEGHAALAVAERFRPEVALLDIGLPGLNGYEVCQRLRRESWGQAMTIVALTGWGQEEDRRRSSEAGFDRHMVKPVDPPALLELLARVRANAPSAEA
jgi:DNA-binding response OmpR family regulator